MKMSGVEVLITGKAGETIDVAPSGSVLAMGNFDGVHRGHRALIDAARAHAASTRTATPVGVLTFEPHPAKVLSPQMAPPLILSLAEKRRELVRNGVDFVATVAFSLDVASMPAARFAREVIAASLHARAVVVGDGFRFGHRALGTPDTLTEAGLEAVVVPSVLEGDVVVSSSKIRGFLLEGKVDIANRLLGYQYFVEGKVVHGDERGRQIGFPTANVDVQRELVVKLGVYATIAETDDGVRHKSVTNVGLRPTFQGQGVRFETHVLDEKLDLYDRTLRVQFVKRLRDEQKFQSLDALKHQIASDAQDARRALEGLL